MQDDTLLASMDKDPKKVKAGQKGGFIKWSKVSKKKRGDMMRKVAEARYRCKQCSTRLLPVTTPDGKVTWKCSQCDK